MTYGKIWFMSSVQSSWLILVPSLSCGILKGLLQQCSTALPIKLIFFKKIGQIQVEVEIDWILFPSVDQVKRHLQRDTVDTSCSSTRDGQTLNTTKRPQYWINTTVTQSQQILKFESPTKLAFIVELLLAHVAFCKFTQNRNSWAIQQVNWS